MIYEGDWKNDYRDGEGTLKNSENELIYKGEWLFDLKEGKASDDAETPEPKKIVSLVDAKANQKVRDLFGQEFVFHDLMKNYRQGVRELLLCNTNDKLWLQTIYYPLRIYNN